MSKDLDDPAVLAMRLGVTDDALASAGDLLESVGPRFAHLDPSALQIIDPERGTLPDADAANLLRDITERCDSIALAVFAAHRQLEDVKALAERIYPRA